MDVYKNKSIHRIQIWNRVYAQLLPPDIYRLPRKRRLTWGPGQEGGRERAAGRRWIYRRLRLEELSELTSWMSSGSYRKSPEHLAAEGIQLLRSLVSKPYPCSWSSASRSCPVRSMLYKRPIQAAHSTDGVTTHHHGVSSACWDLPKRSLLSIIILLIAKDVFFRVQQNLVLSWMTRELPTLIQINQIESFEMSSSFYERFEAVLWVGAQGVTINRIRNREGYTT